MIGWKVDLCQKTRLLTQTVEKMFGEKAENVLSLQCQIKQESTFVVHLESIK